LWTETNKEFPFLLLFLSFELRRLNQVIGKQSMKSSLLQFVTQKWQQQLRNQVVMLNWSFHLHQRQQTLITLNVLTVDVDSLKRPVNVTFHIVRIPLINQSHRRAELHLLVEVAASNFKLTKSIKTTSFLFYL
jgi:hypothetical protein